MRSIGTFLAVTWVMRVHSRGRHVMRLHQSILIGAMALSSWLGMQAVHELGHVCGAWLTSGQVTRVVLDPLTISRTDLGLNPHPLIVVWAGPAIRVKAVALAPARDAVRVWSTLSAVEWPMAPSSVLAAAPSRGCGRRRLITSTASAPGEGVKWRSR